MKFGASDVLAVTTLVHVQPPILFLNAVLMLLHTYTHTHTHIQGPCLLYHLPTEADVFLRALRTWVFMATLWTGPELLQVGEEIGREE